MCVCVCLSLYILLEVGLHGCGGLESLKLAGYAGRLETQGSVAAQVQRHWQNSFLLGGVQSFIPFRSSTNLRRPTQVIKGYLIHPKFANLNSNSIQNPPS